MSEPLPEALGYLRPAIDRLARTRREIDESYDTAAIWAALHKRIRGSSCEEAQHVLKNDRDALEKWLQRMGQHPAHFLVGLFSFVDDVEAVARLLDGPPASPPKAGKDSSRQRRKRPVIDGLTGFEVRKMSVSGIRVSAYTSSDTAIIATGLNSAEGRERVQSFSQLEELSATPVTIGSATGWRYISRGILDKAAYVLSIDQDFALIHVQSRTGSPLEIAEIETHLASLRFE